MQNSCLRVIFGIRRRQRISHKLREVRWLNMYDRRQLHAACFFYKLLKFRVPPYLLNRLTYRTDVHNLNIRRQALLTIPKHNKEIFKRCFSYNIAATINKFRILDFDLSCKVFKRNFFQRLFAVI